MTNIGSASTLKDEFLLGAAKAFFVTAYADFVRNASLDLPRPGAGEDWMDYAPEIPPAAYALAGELWAALEAANKVSVYVLVERAKQAEPKWNGFDADEFGHCLAMQAMGHSVSWFDDHRNFQIKVPSIECSQCSFNDAAFGL